jgi:hypothetical protein
MNPNLKARFPLLMKYKASLIILLLALVIAVRQNRHVVSQPPAVTANLPSDPSAGSDQQPGADAGNGDMLYDSEAQGADPKWAEPANLTPDRAQQLGASTKKLESDIQIVVAQYSDLEEELNALADPKIQETLFERSTGPGFKDKELPKLWRNLSQDNSMIGMAAHSLTAGGIDAALMAGELRLQSAKGDLIGGGLTLGDTLFIASFQKFVDRREAELKLVMPPVADFCERFDNEIPDIYVPYYTTDGVLHDKAWRDAQPLSTADAAALRDSLAGYREQSKFVSDRAKADAGREREVDSIRDVVMAHSNDEIKAAWSVVVNAKAIDEDAGKIANYFELPSDNLVLGKATRGDKAEFDAAVSELQVLSKEADRQHNLQMHFADLIRDNDSLSRVLEGANDGDITLVWGYHLHGWNEHPDDPTMP